jgi:hypothetical protein
MGLIQVATNTVTSAVASVTLTGIDSDDVYMVAINNVQPVVDADYLRMRFTVSGSADTSSNYDRATKELRADTSFGNSYQTNQDAFNFIQNGTGTSETHNNIMYLYNFNNTSEYSFATFEEASFMYAVALRGRTGGGLLTETQATDGVNYFYPNGNIASGTFTLYRVV